MEWWATTTTTETTVSFFVDEKLFFFENFDWKKKGIYILGLGDKPSKMYMDRGEGDFLPTFLWIKPKSNARRGFLTHLHSTYVSVYLSLALLICISSLLCIEIDPWRNEALLWRLEMRVWVSVFFMLNCEEKMCRLERRMNGFAYFKAILHFFDSRIWWGFFSSSST